jgi:hypothetical protein
MRHDEERPVHLRRDDIEHIDVARREQPGLQPDDRFFSAKDGLVEADHVPEVHREHEVVGLCAEHGVDEQAGHVEEPPAPHTSTQVWRPERGRTSQEHPGEPLMLVPRPSSERQRERREGCPLEGV